MATDGSLLARLRLQLGSDVDATSLAIFRLGFGLIAAFAAIRFMALGWIETLIAAPSWHFVWVPGVVEPSVPVLYALFVVQAVAGLAFAAGALVRGPRLAQVLLGPIPLLAWLCSFVYVELIDKSLYLNHYVLFTVLGVVLLASPLHRIHLGGSAPSWVLQLLRSQVALVYFWAGFAKINADWLLRGEPLVTWLQAKGGVPLLGPLLANDALAVAMSWGGMLYDLFVPLLLLWPRTRLLGVVLVVGFHVAVGTLFPIGIFPILMVVSATLLLAPDWPQRLGIRLARPSSLTQAMLPVPGALVWLAVVAVTALFPARFVLYGLDVSWTERGHRFAWRVLLNEKTGMVDYRVVERTSGKVWRVSPSSELTPVQHEQMRTQPDMIRQYALHLRDLHAAEGRDVAVYADSWASLNGRPAQRFIKPEVDLTQSWSDLWSQQWVTPLQE